MSIRIPTDASLSVQAAFREINIILERLTKHNLEMHGRRVTGAGDAVSNDDYVTLRQLRDEVGGGDAARSAISFDLHWDHIGDPGFTQEYLRPHITTDGVLLGNSKPGVAKDSLLVLIATTPYNLNLERYVSGIDGAQLLGTKGHGTALAPTAVLSGDRLLEVGARGFYNGSGGLSAAQAAINMEATENWSSTAQGTSIRFYVTKNGTTVISEGLRLTDTRAVELCKDLFGGFATFGNAQEELTLSTAGPTTNSVANLLPADSILLAVQTRVTVTVTGAGITGLNIGDNTTGARFTNGLALPAGSTSVGTRQWDTSLNAALVGPRQTSAATVLVTAVGGTPTAGKVRISVSYIQMTPPTS